MTGNPQPCTYFNNLDLAILYILGSTPSFCGVKKHAYDTPIVMANPQSRVNVDNVRQIQAQVTEEPSNIIRAVNTGR